MKHHPAIGLLLLALLAITAYAFAQWWLWQPPVQQEIDFGKIAEEYGNDAAGFAKKIHLRFARRLEQQELEGIAKAVKRFPEKNGKAVFDTMTDLRYSLWDEGVLSQIVLLDESKKFENLFFRPSLLAKIGSKKIDAVAGPDFRDFFIETAALNEKLSSSKKLYLKIVRESRRFKGAQSQDITLVIVLRKGTRMKKTGIEKTIESAFENSKNLEIQNISRIAVYDASGKGKLVTIYGRQDWIDKKMS